MKNVFSRQNFRIFLIVILIITVGLIGFYGYNEHIYSKIGICFSEGNYSLAENYIDSISPSYKDVRKIKNLISVINNHNSGNEKDLERMFSRLEAFKGFQNDSVNQVYNSFLFQIYKELNVSAVPVQNQIAASPYITTALIETTAVTTSPYTATTSVPTYTTEKITEKSVYSSEATAPYPTTTKEVIYYTTETTAKQYQYSEEATTNKSYSTDVVYYVESGEVYHITPDCRTLANSKNIFSGPIPEGRRACKVCG